MQLIHSFQICFRPPTRLQLKFCPAIGLGRSSNSNTNALYGYHSQPATSTPYMIQMHILRCIYSPFPKAKNKKYISWMCPAVPIRQLFEIFFLILCLFHPRARGTRYR